MKSKTKVRENKMLNEYEFEDGTSKISIKSKNKETQGYIYIKDLNTGNVMTTDKALIYLNPKSLKNIKSRITK